VTSTARTHSPPDAVAAAYRLEALLVDLERRDAEPQRMAAGQIRRAARKRRARTPSAELWNLS